MRFFLIVCLLSAAACQVPQPPPPGGGGKAGYRALGNYCRDEIARLKAQQLGVTKTIRLNGQATTAPVSDSTGLEALFRPLMDADVSKPSLAGDYDTDTIADQFKPGDTTFIIQSKGKQTWPYRLILDVDGNGRIKTAQTTSYTKNLMYDYRQEVYYERNRELRVSTSQQIIFMKPEHLEVQARFGPAKQPI
ncbi:hypothetical protein ACWKWU_09285 [Chitinophaga lutea]